MFVFKHKTAYEMRISDWSSDVCSSDLGQLRTEINGGEPIRMFSLQHLGIKTIWAARLINGAFREIWTYEQITGAMPLRDGAKAFRAAVKSMVNVQEDRKSTRLNSSH